MLGFNREKKINFFYINLVPSVSLLEERKKKKQFLLQHKETLGTTLGCSDMNEAITKLLLGFFKCP